MGSAISSDTGQHCVYVEGLDPKMSADKINHDLMTKWGVMCTKVIKNVHSTGATIYFDSRNDMNDSLERLQEVRVGNHSLRWKVVTKSIQQAKKAILIEENAEKIIDRDDNLITPWDAVDYDEQIAQKSLSLVRILSEMFDAHYPSISVIKSPRITQYQNRFQFAVGYDITGKPAIGFLYGTRRKNYVVPLKHCRAPAKQMKAIVGKFKKFMCSTATSPFSSVTGIGIWKSLLVRCSENEILIAVEATRYPTEDLIKKLQNSFRDVTSLYIRVNQHFKHILGKDFIEDTIGFNAFHIKPTTPFPENTEAYLQFLKSFTQMPLFQKKTIVGLYCGCGATVIGLAKNAERVIGIEANWSARDEAARSAKANAAYNVRVIAGGIQETIANECSSVDSNDLVFLIEPPKVGSLKRVFKTIRSKAPLYFVVKSDSIGAQAAEIVKVFMSNEEGPKYKYYDCVAADFWPCSERVECAVAFKRVD